MSVDSRWADLARQLAEGTQVETGTKVGIFVTDSQAMDAVSAFVDEVYRRGGLPQVLNVDERFDQSAVAFASDEVLATAGHLEELAMKWADVHVSFRGMALPPSVAQDPVRLAKQRKAKGKISTLRWRETRWCLVRVPTPDWANLIGASFETLLDEFFAGCIADWSTLDARWSQLCTELDGEQSIRIVSDDTDLRFSTTGRNWITFAGEANLPDGEIATAPVDNSATGFITFPGTLWFAGARIQDLRLEFEDGAVVKATATEGAELVNELLDTDEGSRRVGELGIGTNASVKTFTGDLLIDEKILGTVHIALGRAYPACGGVNESALHWDIVKDLRSDSSYLYAGDRAIIDEGKPTGLLAPL